MSKEKFVELANELEVLAAQADAKRQELEAVMLELGEGALAQDPETLAVYKVIVPTGTFISFRKIDYKRTNKEGEKGGGPSVLAKKEAEEAGFVLKK